MTRLDTDQMKKGLNESYNFIWILKKEAERQEKEQYGDRRKSS